MQEFSPVKKPLAKSVTFADVAHGYVVFDAQDPAHALVLELVDTAWFQRLRNIRQTGNTNLVYMFAEHSRFGHCIGVAYLALLLMENLAKQSPDQVAEYKSAVAAAALLHDLGHVAPGSHLAERVWATGAKVRHETVSLRAIAEDPEISTILKRYDPQLPSLVHKILANDNSLPKWTTQILSGGGWNADRGNWSIVDSTMCAVSYGRYNVSALIDSFQLSQDNQLVLLENRVDALTHFFVARDSMYRQVYQHRVLQSADLLNQKIVQRLKDILLETNTTSQPADIAETFKSLNVFADATLLQLLSVNNYAQELPLDVLFNMTESWWKYHLDAWCSSSDKILADLSLRLRDRKLLKTIRMDVDTNLLEVASKLAEENGYDPRYYVTVVDSTDKHRADKEAPPLILKDNGQLSPVSEIEPMIAYLGQARPISKKWLVLPKSIKALLQERRDKE